jgi:nitrogen regulatory protein P-II 1
MKMIVAIVRPAAINALKEALCDAGVKGMTLTEVRGFGRQRGKTEIFRGVEYTVDFIPKLQIELLVKDENVENIVDMITKMVKTGEAGDGKIFIYPVEDVVRIRTGEKGEGAI